VQPTRLPPKKKGQRWTESEDENLRNGEEKFRDVGKSKWRRVSVENFYGQRKPEMCRRRFKNLHHKDSEQKDIADMQKEIEELKEKVTQLQDERNEEQGTRKRKSDESATPVAIYRGTRSKALEQDLKIARSKFRTLDLWATDMRGRSQPSLTPGKGVMIMESLIQGNGVFATSGFKKGDRIVEYKSDVIDAMEKIRREKIYVKTIFGSYLFASGDKFIDATLSHTLARFINHSDDPNAYAGEQPQP
jgi:hypothetical protein